MARGRPRAMWSDTDVTSSGYQVGIDPVVGATANDAPSLWSLRTRRWSGSRDSVMHANALCVVAGLGAAARVGHLHHRLHTFLGTFDPEPSGKEARKEGVSSHAERAAFN